MSDPPFDPSKTVTFDLKHGLVDLEGTPGVLVPSDELLALCAAAGAEATETFGRGIGRWMGHRVVGRFGGGKAVRAASLGAVVDHLSGEWAIAGLGAFGLERWGRALVIVIDRSPLGSAADRLLSATLEGAIHTATGRAVALVLLDSDPVRARFLVGSIAAAGRVREWLGQGLSWGEALARLHAPSEGAQASRGDA
jgi:hypothetical protein